MNRYIGMDVHAMSCTVCIVGHSGRQLKSDVVETNGQALVEYLRNIPRPRHLCFEEGTQSAWLHEILSPHVDELVVVGVTRSRGAKSDAKDALGLAQALRLGAIDTTVFKAPSRFARLRALATSYDQITRDVTRTQTRIKALFRARCIPALGQMVYSPAQRPQWLEKLPQECRASAELLWQELDAQRELKRAAEKQLIAESHRHPISTILETCHGFDPIRAALSIPVVVTPNRFRTSRQLWSYSGLGIVMRSSADWVKRSDGWVRAETAKTRGLNRCFNRTLTYVFKGAATTVITKLPGSPLQQRYAKLLEAGTKPKLPKLTIAATFLSMWKARGDLRSSTASSSIINVRQSEVRHDRKRTAAVSYLSGEHGSKVSIHGAWPRLRGGGPKSKICPFGVPNEAMALRSPDRRMVPAFWRRTKLLRCQTHQQTLCNDSLPALAA